MPEIEDPFGAKLAAAHAAAAALPADLSLISASSDEQLLRAQASLAEIERIQGAFSSLLAGELVHRSRPELGYAGLAQRTGHRTAKGLIQHTTGGSGRRAAELVTVGVMARTAADPSDTVTEPWLSPVGAAVKAGFLSIGAAAAIRSGLGVPTAQDDSATVTSAHLRVAAQTLLAEAARLDVDQLLTRARQLRDDLDIKGIGDREREIYEARSFRRVKRPNGLSRYIWDPDIETSAYVDDMFDKITAPRRGVRFVDKRDQARADALATDSRTTDQYVHDAIAALLRIGASAETDDSKAIVGVRQPVVTVLTTQKQLDDGQGRGWIEGVSVPVSLATVERMACTGSVQSIAFDEHNDPLRLEREQRLFSRKQRIVLAARDGGCSIPGCDRPASWTEAHHIRYWSRDGGGTNIEEGILLCRHHHMLMHNNGWEIVRRDHEFWLIPPPDIDPTQTPRHMPSKSRALRDLARERRDESGSARDSGTGLGAGAGSGSAGVDQPAVMPRVEQRERVPLLV